MRVLVTGAAGFVGRHLCRGLGDYGYEVIGSDRQEGMWDGPTWSHFKSMLWSFDLAQSGHSEDLVNWAKPDYVVHLAARYGRILCRDEPHLAVQDNAAATTELAAVCAEKGIPVLYASSSEVYGDHGTDWITEESELRTPTTIYGLSKRWGEEALSLYLPPEKLCIVRMNMLYGPEQLGGYGRCALATFIKNSVEGKSITVHRNATRSWLYISDAVRALCELIDWGKWGIWNLGNQHEYEDLQRTARRITRDIVFQDAPPDQILVKNYDSTKLEKALDWKPEVDLAEGIIRTVEWARGEVVANA